MTCCGCAEEFDYDSCGVLVSPASGQPGPKSGRPVPVNDVFPDGSEQKFICSRCLFETRAAEMLGFYDTGHDFPPQETQDELYCVQPPNTPWPEIP